MFGLSEKALGKLSWRQYDALWAAEKEKRRANDALSSVLIEQMAELTAMVANTGMCTWENGPRLSEEFLPVGWRDRYGDQKEMELEDFDEQMRRTMERYGRLSERSGCARAVKVEEGSVQLDMSELQGLSAKLAAGAAAVDGPAKKRALRAGGRVMKRAIQQFAPVLSQTTAASTALPPGTLRENTRVLTIQDTGEPEVLVGPTGAVEHVARWVEYGHRSVKGGYSVVLAGGKTRGPGKAGSVDVPAHPYIRPAFESAAVSTAEAIQESLAESVKEAVR